MKKILILLTIILLQACFDEPDHKWICVGELTSIRVDDDGEYHFTTDYRTIHDEYKFSIIIQRDNIDKPMLYVEQEKCPEGKHCNSAHEDWREVQLTRYKFVLPYDYKIETFDD